MFKQSFKQALASTTVALLLTATFVAAQGDGPTLKITRTSSAEKQRIRNTPIVETSRSEAFKRLHPADSNSTQMRINRRGIAREDRTSRFSRNHQSVSAPTLQSFATGGGDINETEPNGSVAQSVSLPVNIFGKIRNDGDADFFAFQALAGQQITIEPFAARFSGSRLVADIGLFDSNGNLLASDVGDDDNDPLIRFTPVQDQILIAGITDADDFGGSRFDYLLNITRGSDAEEIEPNGSAEQVLTGLPVTIFGDIDGRNDVDFYSFVASAGQTLILDLDADVIGSQLDAEMNLLDPQTGVEYFYNDQEDGNDPRFNIVLPFTGRYVIGIGAFNSNSAGFYRLNASLVSGTGAPILTGVTRVSKKLFDVAGTGFSANPVVEVNGKARKTTLIGSGILRAKVKARAGDVVTVSNSPDDRRSNPLVVQ